MTENLNGKVALVTGAAARLGRAIAIGLADSGCDLILHYGHSQKDAERIAAEIRACGRRAMLLRADLSKSKQTLRLARDAEVVFGRVDILINSAAIFRPTPLEKLNEKELDAFLQINLKSPYLLSSEIGRRMKKRGAGCIINLACLTAQRPWKNYLPYSISKAGLVSMTLGMALLLSPEVRVNAIAPGAVLLPTDATPTYRRALINAAPLKKIGAPEDIVLAVRYLCQASFVTGQILGVDGGRAIRNNE
ncbi:MAG: SDR family oxidoreductase [Planctomycetota bacterium]